MTNDVAETMARQFAIDKAKKMYSEPENIREFLGESFREQLDGYFTDEEFDAVGYHNFCIDIKEDVISYALTHLITKKIRGNVTPSKMKKRKLQQVELGTLWWMEEDGRQLFSPIDFALEVN